MKSPMLFVSVLLVMCLSVLASNAAGQASPAQINEPHGDQPFGAYQTSDIDNIGFASGSLDVKIPLFAHSGRGLTHQKFWTYTTKAWTQMATTPPCDPTVAECPPATPLIWGYVSLRDALSNIQQYTTSGCGDGHMHSEYTNFTYLDPTGTQHTFDAVLGGEIPPPNCIHPKTVGYSLDNSGMRFDLNGALTLKDGTIVGSTTLLFRDANGNSITAVGNTQEIDTLGRVIQHATGTLPDGAQYEDWIAQDSAGNPQKTRIEWVMLPVCTDFQQGDTVEACGGGGIKLARKIDLPSGLAYQFTYDTGTTSGHYGELLRIDLPSGGYIRYEYAPISSALSVYKTIRVIKKRVVSADGTAASEKIWTYDYQLATPDVSHNTTLVTDPDGNQTAHVIINTLLAIGSPAPLETETRFYQGSGTLLKKVQTDYATLTVHVGDADDPITTARQLGRPIRITTTLDNGLTSKVEMDYDSLPDTNGVISFSRSNVTEKREYGFGQGAPGPLLRRTTFTYLHNANSAYATANIVDKALNTTVYDGSNNVVAQTQNIYDGTSLASTNSGTCQNPIGAPNHDYCAFGTSNLVRGNLTSVRKWRNTDNTWLITNFNYDDLGNVVSSSDPGGHQTTISYSDSWSGASCTPTGVNTYAFPTQITDPLNLRTQASYFSCPGLVQSKRNENDILASRAGTAFTYDGMNRVQSITAPDGGVTSFDYHNDTLPLTVTKTQTATPDPSIVSSVVYDGLGRVKTTSLDSDPLGADVVDTTYDNLGQKQTVSNPHRAVTAPTDGITTYQYDALGRVIQVAPPDGTSPSGGTCLANNVCTQYSGNTTTVTDQAGKQRRSISDALGRLIEVDEPSASATGINATATVTINGHIADTVVTGGPLHTAAAGSPVSSVVMSDGTAQTFYFDGNHHVNRFYSSSTASWVNEDITASTGNTVADAGSGLAASALADGTLHVFYLGTNQHVYQLVYSGAGWQNQDLTAITGNTLAASGSVLASDSGAAGEPVHLYYLGTNQHIYCLFVGTNSIWQNQDLTAATGNTLAASGSKLSVSVLSDGTTRLFYLGTNQHVYQLMRNNGGSFGAPFLASSNFTDAQSWNQPAYYSSIRLGDVNGDGKADVCGRSSGGLMCGLNNGTGMFNAAVQWEGDFTDAGGWNQLQYGSTMMFADINGDSKADVCGRGQSAIYCKPSNGTSFGTAILSSNFTDAQGWNQSAYYTSLRLADVNGDGKRDLCGRGSGGIVCALNTGSGAFGTQTLWESSFTDAASWNLPQYGSTIMFADINGDGKADVCGRSVNGIACELSNGAGFGTAYIASPDFSDAQGWNQSAYYPSLRLADVNGDGKPDVCGRGMGGVVCALNNGNGTFGPARQWEGNFTDAGGWNQAQYGTTVMFADINGDGRADLCGRGVTGIVCELSTGNAVWQNSDITAATGNTLAAAGSAIAFDPGLSGGGMHVYYLGTNQHIYYLTLNTTTLNWQNFDLTAVTVNGSSTTTHQPAAGTSLTALVSNDGYVRLYFQDPSQHIHETFCCSSGSWVDNDMMNVLGISAAASGTALASFGMAAGSNAHVHYLGPNQHVFHMYYNTSSGWANQDVSGTSNTRVIDSGVVSLNVGGFTATGCYGASTNPSCATQQQNYTASDVASSLATAINVSGSPATAVATGATINLTWKAVGPFTPSVSSLTTSHDNGTLFLADSFSSQATSFGNGGGPLAAGNVYVTKYAYDTLDNLYCVEQHGNAGTGTACPATPPGPTDSPVAPDPNNAWRRRLFAYDSLSRLRWASNPESGAISYSYDLDGNLLQKTSPAPNQTGTATQTVSYCFDSGHRVTGKAYSAQACPLTSPVVTYAYDSGTNNKGHLTSLADQAGTGSYGYDLVGRLKTETRSLTGANNAAVSKSISYDYDLGGAVTALHYPSGAVVSYTPDGAGHTIQAVDTANSISYVTSATYGPDGALTGFVSGYSSTFAGITNSFSYNKRLQPVNMSASSPSQTVFSIGYDFHLGSGDNGNVWGIANNRDTTRNQSFGYDALNRLISAQNAGTDCNATILGGNKKFWGNTYSYDAWGNLTNKTKIPAACAGENLAVTAGANNQLGSGYLYDAAGNMTHDATTTLNYTFDQENRITGANGYIYTYDADGNRVRKSNGNTASNGTLYWYMTPGVVAETDLAGTLKSEYVFFDGDRVARKDFPANTVAYYFSDHLKTASVITNASGTITAESDYYPWGGELQFVNNDPNDYKFTGKKRDTETGLDYFGARYYSSALGRFLTPDWAAKAAAVPYAELADPQSLNLYSYVRNRPTVMGDPDGHAEEPKLTLVDDKTITNKDGTTTHTQTFAGEPIPGTLPSGNPGTVTSLTTVSATYDADGKFVSGYTQPSVQIKETNSDGKSTTSTFEGNKAALKTDPEGGARERAANDIKHSNEAVSGYIFHGKTNIEFRPVVAVTKAAHAINQALIDLIAGSGPISESDRKHNSCDGFSSSRFCQQ